MFSYQSATVGLSTGLVNQPYYAHDRALHCGARQLVKSRFTDLKKYNLQNSQRCQEKTELAFGTSAPAGALPRSLRHWKPTPLCPPWKSRAATTKIDQNASLRRKIPTKPHQTHKTSSITKEKYHNIFEKSDKYRYCSFNAKCSLLLLIRRLVVRLDFPKFQSLMICWSYLSSQWSVLVDFLL